MRSVLVLRNSNDIIMNSINIKQYTENIVTCRPNMTLLSLLNYFRIRDIEPHISQENIIKAFQALSVPMNTLWSLFCYYVLYLCVYFAIGHFFMISIDCLKIEVGERER